MTIHQRVGNTTSPKTEMWGRVRVALSTGLKSQGVRVSRLAHDHD